MGDDDTILARWSADRATYIRDHLIMAAVGAAGCTIVLFALGNPDPWVGIVAAFLAIAVRGFYLASEELALVWQLTGSVVRGSNGKSVALASIKQVRGIGSAVQLITQTGDKYLMKYLSDPAAVRARIETACNLQRDPS